MQSSDVVILGGGIAGCLTAYYLAQRGVKATVVEREAIGSHASGYAFGGLSYHSGSGIPGPVFPIAKAGYFLHEGLYDDLLEATGVDTHYRKGANVKIAFTSEEARDLEEEVAWQTKLGIDSKIIDLAQVQQIEPRVNPEAISFRYIEESAAVEAYRLSVAVMQAAEKLGAVLRHGNAVGIKRNGSRPEAVLTESGEEIPCDTVVVAMGPWSTDAASWLDFPVPVWPLKGQIVRLEMPGEPLACWFGYHDSYCGTKADGLTWCGTTEENAGFDVSTHVQAMNSVISDAVKMIPSLAEARLALQTACLRPMASDLFPIVGPVPGWKGVYMCTGGGRKGILLGPGMAKIVADLITTGHSDIDHSGILPSRFSKD